ncbi:hypothetical protein [Enhygromyxa salina]|nr:hypothetical protein [Enhygromyxa salina]
MKVSRQPDKTIFDAVWSAIAQSGSAPDEWSVRSTSFFGTSQEIRRDAAPTSVLSWETVTLAYEKTGSTIKLSRNPNVALDDLAAFPNRKPLPQQPANANTNHLNYKQWTKDRDVANKNNKILEQHLPLLDSVYSNLAAALSHASTSPDTVVSDMVSRRDAQLARFELHIEELTKTSVRRREQLENEYQERKTALGTAAAQELAADKDALRAEFDEYKAELEANTSEIRNKLADRKAAVTAREEAADLNDNRSARRNLRNAMMDIINEREESFSLTDETQGKRTPVLWASGLTMASLFATLVVIILFSDVGPQDLLARSITQVVLSAGFLGTLLFFLRFTQNWAKQHADEEFYLKRLKLDLERANWLVEMSLEYAQERNEPIPAETFASLSRGLFQVASTPETLHPYEALLGSASEANVTIPHVDLKLKRRGLRNLQKQAEKLDAD